MNGMAYGRDLEVVHRLKPEPMTPEEEAAQEKKSILWILISSPTK